MDTSKHVFMHDHGLIEVRGAQYALDKITAKTQELSLGHNSLGSQGVVYLFQQLRLLRERWACGIEKVTLSSNGIGNEALREMAVYLDGDRTLKELYLPHNAIDGSEHMAEFAAAIRKSSLRVLSLNNNPITPDALDLLLDGIAPPSYRRAEGEAEDGQDDFVPSPSWAHSPDALPTPPSSLPNLSQHLAFEVLNPPRARAASWSEACTPHRTRAPHSLTDLHFSGCSVRLQGARSLARFIADPDRVGGLQLLALNNCDLGSRGSLLLSRALAGWCLTLEGLQISSNHARAQDTFADEDTQPANADRDWPMEVSGGLRGGEVQALLASTLEEEKEVMTGRFRLSDGSVVDLSRLRGRRRRHVSLDELDGPDRDLALFSGGDFALDQSSSSPRSLALSHHRLEALLEGVGGSVMKTATTRVRLATGRNQALKAAVRRNALAMLPVARILLSARERTDAECGRDVMREMMSSGSKSWSGVRTLSPSPSPPPTSGRSSSMSSLSNMSTTEPFRFNDLPSDLVPMVLSHVQADASTLSDKQTRALLAYARDPDTLHTERRMVDHARDQRRRSQSGLSTPARDIYRPAFRPGPGHYGRAEWQLIVSGQYGRTRATALGSGGGGVMLVDAGTDGNEVDEVCYTEREGVDDLLRRLGCDGWDAFED